MKEPWSATFIESHFYFHFPRPSFLCRMSWYQKAVVSMCYHAKGVLAKKDVVTRLSFLCCVNSIHEFAIWLFLVWSESQLSTLDDIEPVFKLVRCYVLSSLSR